LSSSSLELIPEVSTAMVDTRFRFFAVILPASDVHALEDTASLSGTVQGHTTSLTISTGGEAESVPRKTVPVATRGASTPASKSLRIPATKAGSLLRTAYSATNTSPKAARAPSSEIDESAVMQQESTVSAADGLR
jgi:hypothetical protein